MKLVFASDSFKGSLSSAEICGLLEDAAHDVFPEAECVSLLIADGGEGTLDAIAAVRAGERVTACAHDGLMRPVKCDICVCGNQAFVEAASSCGLTLLGRDERNPLLASSYGVGECIRCALERGCSELSIGLGGSCTNDGGMGCLRALGVRFLDPDGCELRGCGSDLARVDHIDTAGLHPLIREARIVIMADVSNPLLGPNGATYVFGRQKGADDAMLADLEDGMRHYAEAVHALCPDVDMDTPGYGAAGGLGMALAVFGGARIESGIEELLSWIDFDSLVSGADLVVTGEGCLDAQSLQGKAVSAIVAHANRAHVPAVVICGTTALDEHALHTLGPSRVIEIAAGQDTASALANAKQNYTLAARTLFEQLVAMGCVLSSD